MKILLALALILSAPTVASAAPSPAKRTLNIGTLPAEQQADLLKRYPQILNGRLSLEVVDEIIRYLQGRPEYDLIQVVDSGNDQLKLVTEKSTRIIAVKFEGIKALSDSETKSLFGVLTNDVLNQDSLIAGGERLRQQYSQIGYRNASIDMEIPPDGQGNVEVVVKVKEGVQTLIGSIQFISPNQELNKSIGNRLARQRNNALTDAELADVQKKTRDYLSNQGYIRAEITGPEITFNTDESRAQLLFKLEKVDSYSIEFAGNREVSSSTLSNSLDLKTFYSASPNIGAELAARIKSLYLSRGYARAEVLSEETEGRKPSTRRITLNVDEGPKIRISKFEFSGTISRDNRYYTSLLKKHASDLIQREYYNKDELDQAFRTLVIELQNEGYLLAKINSTRTQYNREKTQVAIFVNMDEGSLTQIEDIHFIGNSALTADELLRVTELNRNEPLKLASLEKAIANLRQYYQEKGYIDMAILNDKENLVIYNDNNTLAQLNFKIYEGPQVSVASIVLDGNSFTRDSVLLTVIDLQPGDIVTPNKIDEAKAKLQRTGYFNSVEVRTLEEKTTTANRTLIIKITERDPGLFTMGAGATSDQGVTLRGFIGLAYNNIFGTGRGVSARVDGQYNITRYRFPENKVALGYLEPYLFGSKFRGRVNLSFSSLITDYEIHKVSNVLQTNYSVERDLTSHITVIWDAYGIATVADRGISPDFAIPATKQDIGTTGFTTELDFRDSPFTPTRGNFTNLSTEYSSPELGSSRTDSGLEVPTKEIKYIRGSGSFTQYMRLPYFKNDFMVWANSVRGGYIRNLSTSGGVPYDKKGFFLGGSATIRGFDGSSEYFPSKNQLGIAKTDTFYLTSVATMYLYKSELRFPLFGSIGGSVFYDGGAVLIDGVSLTDVYRDSAGIGVHYNTPVGPLNIELAWKVDAKPDEDPVLLHLSIGSF